MEQRPAVVADGVSKSFRIPREQVHTLKERALHPFRRAGHDELRALDEVSFSVPKGEFFGIVGRNGSGKSTLLKCLAGIYRADAGRIFVDGRMSTFIELGVGFNPDLAARDNVMLNGTMLGLSPRESRRRFDKIVEFAELEDFVDLKLKNYSSGMLVRLAFSVMIQVDAEILLVDEVLAVGDAAFQQKCFDEFGRIRRSGTTVLLVTHDMGAVRRFCDRALLLHRGDMAGLGDPETIGDRYLQLNFADAGEVQAVVEAENEEEVRLGDQHAEVLEAWFEDDAGVRCDAVQGGSRTTFAARVRLNADLDDPVFGVELLTSNDDHVWEGSTGLLDPEGSGTFRAGEEVVYRLTFDNVLAPDRYHATPVVSRREGGFQVHDRRSRLVSLVVHGTRRSAGLVEIPYEAQVQRLPSVAATERR
ncbi:ABC transporter ATP-binding protein [Conexibacter sp. SYSU D00693]|uniref:ABC transporter ATP-binding protein n=1 Tax=Conexibacter sp. SYSU D00693 TaxID=2812560 RepID=UPI00196BA675|nr:ABC transporter ATP-binding protein [Conexibacter sp. SYSU D00693]